MSFDVFVQGFHHGDPAPLPSAVFHAIFGPYVDQAERQRNYWHVTATDRSKAGIYADVDGERFNGLMVSHFDDGGVLDLLAEFARMANAVIMPVGCPTLLAAPGQREHLPEGLLHTPTIIIANGHDITTAIMSA